MPGRPCSMEEVGRGGLKGIQSPVEFVCGYAVGVMFSNYGFGAEVQSGLSERAMKAANQCVSTAARQGITSEKLSMQSDGKLR